MVEVTSQQEGQLETRDYLFTEDMNEPDEFAFQKSETSESMNGENEGRTDAAMKKMQKLAQKIYDTTPGINDSKLQLLSRTIRNPSDSFSLLLSNAEEIVENFGEQQARRRVGGAPSPQRQAQAREVRIDRGAARESRRGAAPTRQHHRQRFR